jgi:hypothetical protein
MRCAYETKSGRDLLKIFRDLDERGCIEEARALKDWATHYVTNVTNRKYFTKREESALKQDSYVDFYKSTSAMDVGKFLEKEEFIKSKMKIDEQDHCFLETEIWVLNDKY